MTAPTVTVEVAFTSTFSTPEGSRVWTDVSSYVEAHEELAITFARPDERTQADANSLTLTFDNTDGRFTPEKTTGAYYPNVKLYRPIRITAQYSGGTARRRMTGYVLSWTPAWDGGSEALAQVKVAAASRMKRLAEADELRSVVVEESSVDGPGATFALDEPDTALEAVDSSGYATPSLTRTLGPYSTTTTAVAFGTPGAFGAEGPTCATFADGEVLVRLSGGGGDVTSSTLTCWVKTTSTTAAGIAYFHNGHGFYLDSAGRVLLGESNIGIVYTGPVINDGAWHHIAGTWVNGVASTLYVGGVLAGSGAASAFGQGSALVLGSGSGFPGYGSFTGSLALVNLYRGSALSAARIAVHAASPAGFVGETSAARLGRYLSWRGVPAAEVDTVDTSRTVQAFDTTGMSVLDAARMMESTEGGVLYDGKDGHTRLVGEASRYTATSSFTLDLTEQSVTADFAPDYDDAQLINDVTGESTDGMTARVVNQSSVSAYGRVAETTKTASMSTAAPVDDAAWIVSRYAEPATRLANVTVAVHGLTDTVLREAIMAADVGTLLTISNLPSQFPVSSGTWFVEGYGETFGVGTHYITFNLSPSAAYLAAFVLDSGTRGVLDTNTLGH